MRSTPGTCNAPDLTLGAIATDSYQRLLNRAPDSSIAMKGNTDLLNLWNDNLSVRWEHQLHRRASRFRHVLVRAALRRTVAPGPV